MSIFSIEVTWLACRRQTSPLAHALAALCLPQWQTKLNAIWCVSCTPRRYWWKCVVIIICDNWWAESIFLVVFSFILVIQMELQQFSKRPTARRAVTVNKYMSRMALDALQRHANPRCQWLLLLLPLLFPSWHLQKSASSDKLQCAA